MQPSRSVNATQRSRDASPAPAPSLYHSQQHKPRLQKQNGFANKPFVPPTRDPSVVWFDHLPSSRTHISRPREAQRSDHDIRSAFANTAPRPAKLRQVDRIAVALEQDSATMDEYDSVHDYVQPPPAKRFRGTSDELRSVSEEVVAANHNSELLPGTADHGSADLIELTSEAWPWPLACSRDLSATEICLDISLAVLHRLTKEALLPSSDPKPGNPYDQDLPYAAVAAGNNQKVLPTLSSLSRHERSTWHSRLMHLLRTWAAPVDQRNVPAVTEALAQVADEIAGALANRDA